MAKKVTREDMDKAQGWADLFQFGSLGLLFGSIFLLESLSKATARVVVWYIAGVLFITATIGFVLGMRATKMTSEYFKQRLDGIRTRYDF